VATVAKAAVRTVVVADRLSISATGSRAGRTAKVEWTDVTTYKNLIDAIGERARELYGPNWGLAEVAAEALWKSCERATGLSWEEVESDIRAAWERAGPPSIQRYH